MQYGGRKLVKSARQELCPWIIGNRRDDGVMTMAAMDFGVPLITVGMCVDKYKK